MANQYADALYKAINTIANDATQDLAAKLPEYFVGKVTAAASGDTTGYVVQMLGSERPYDCSASSVYKLGDIVMVQVNGSTHTIIGYAEQPFELQKFFNFYYDSNACYSSGSGKNNVLTAQIRGGGDLVWFSVVVNSTGFNDLEEIEEKKLTVQINKGSSVIAKKIITINDIEGNPYDINDTLKFKFDLPKEHLSEDQEYQISVTGEDENTPKYFSNVTAYVGKSDGKRFTYETGFRLAATQVSGGPYSTDYTSLTLDYTQPTGAYYLKATFELNGVDVAASEILSNLTYSIDGKTVTASLSTNDITLDINSYRGKDTAYVKATADWVLNGTETLHLQDQLPIIIKNYPELQITKNAAGTGLKASLLIAGAASTLPTQGPWSEMPSSEEPALPRVQYNWKDINSGTVVVNGGPEFTPSESQEPDLTKWACSAFVNEDDSTLASPNNHYIGTAYLAAGEDGEMGPTGPQGEAGPTGPSGISATMYIIEAPWELDKDAGGKFADTVVDTVFKVKRNTGGENPEYMTGGCIVFSFLPSGDDQTISFNGVDSIQPIWEDTISTPHVWMLGPTSGGNATPLTDVEQIICEYYSADDSLCEHKLDTHKIDITQEFFLPDFIKNWNGKTIFGDNFIASPQGGFGATGPSGFTGVLLGAFQPTGASGESSYNGIAGFKENERTFKLDAESGLASFGTKAKGELVFDPANGLIIESGNYVYDPGTPTGHGMSVKFQDGGPSGYEGPYIRWGNGNFEVNKDGNVWINGKLTFSAASSPVKIVYNESGNSTTSLANHWDDIPLSPSGTYAGWHKTENSNTDRYAAYTYDGGHSWTDAIKVRGEDGTSVSVKQNADACTQIGDGYIDNISSSIYYGHLMILTSWPDHSDPTTKVFTDAGEIKGPQGEKGDKGEQGPQGSTGTSATNYYITSNYAALHRNALGEFEEASITFSAWEKTGSGNPTGSSQYWSYKIDDDNWTSISTKASTKSISKSSYSSATKKLIVGIFSNSGRTILLAQIVIPVEAVLPEFIKDWDGKSAQLEGNHVIAMQAAFGTMVGATGGPTGFTGVVLGSISGSNTGGIFGLYTKTANGSSTGAVDPDYIYPSGDHAGEAFAEETFRLDAATGEAIFKKGEIAGWKIEPSSLTIGNFGATGSIHLYPTGDSPTGSLAGSDSKNDWRFTIGNNFGVDNSGSLFASSGKIAGWNITSNSLESDYLKFKNDFGGIISFSEEDNNKCFIKYLNITEKIRLKYSLTGWNNNANKTSSLQFRWQQKITSEYWQPFSDESLFDPLIIQELKKVYLIFTLQDIAATTSTSINDGDPYPLTNITKNNNISFQNSSLSSNIRQLSFSFEDYNVDIVINSTQQASREDLYYNVLDKKITLMGNVQAINKPILGTMNLPFGIAYLDSLELIPFNNNKFKSGSLKICESVSAPNYGYNSFAIEYWPKDAKDKPHYITNCYIEMGQIGNIQSEAKKPFIKLVAGRGSLEGDWNIPVGSSLTLNGSKFVWGSITNISYTSAGYNGAKQITSLTTITGAILTPIVGTSGHSWIACSIRSISGNTINYTVWGDDSQNRASGLYYIAWGA